MDPIRKCSRCGYSTSNPQAKFCRRCGTSYSPIISKDTSRASTTTIRSFQQPQKRCLKCGSVKHLPSARYCKVCGGLLDSSATIQTSDKITLPEFDDIIRIARKKKEREEKDRELHEKELINQIKTEIEADISDTPPSSSIEEELGRKIERILSKLQNQTELEPKKVE
ncbi:MAG: zinc ribbon domain-containing protein [Promethearchaeota archaeon]